MLEKNGKLVRDVRWNKSKPVNNYLPIDRDDHGFTARIVDNHGWLFVIFEWLDRNIIRQISSIDMGESANYVEQVGDELIVKWPAWAIQLFEAGRASFVDFDTLL